MKYLLINRRKDASDNPFTEIVAAGEGAEFELPFRLTCHELSDLDVADARRDPSIEDVILSIVLTLIKPVSESLVSPIDENAWGVEAVGADTSTQTGNGVTVAVLDTGIDISHPAFSGINFAHEDLWDFTIEEQGTPGSAHDVNGHGTHVAGTIFGRDVNGTRIGVAPGIKKALIGKVLGPNGAPTETVVTAIDWALRRRADVISMSLGIDFSGIEARLRSAGFPADIAFSRALEAYRSNVRLFDSLAALVQARVARGRGALLVAASGNESQRETDPRFTVATAPPAAADGFISVGALSREPRVVAPFSNTGCLVSAPGVAILSAKFGGGLAMMSGTSMATPHVAGILALWTEKLFPNRDRPNGWAGDVQRQLEHNVKPITGQVRNDVGLGIVQAPQ
jgi:subtilisin family serine protease